MQRIHKSNNSTRLIRAVLYVTLYAAVMFQGSIALAHGEVPAIYDTECIIQPESECWGFIEDEKEIEEPVTGNMISEKSELGLTDMRLNIFDKGAREIKRSDEREKTLVVVSLLVILAMFAIIFVRDCINDCQRNYARESGEVERKWADVRRSMLEEIRVQRTANKKEEKKQVASEEEPAVETVRAEIGDDLTEVVEEEREQTVVSYSRTGLSSGQERNHVRTGLDGKVERKALGVVRTGVMKERPDSERSPGKRERSTTEIEQEGSQKAPTWREITQGKTAMARAQDVWDVWATVLLSYIASYLLISQAAVIAGDPIGLLSQWIVLQNDPRGYMVLAFPIIIICSILYSIALLLYAGWGGQKGDRQT